MSDPIPPQRLTEIRKRVRNSAQITAILGDLLAEIDRLTDLLSTQQSLLDAQTTEKGVMLVEARRARRSRVAVESLISRWRQRGVDPYLAADQVEAALNPPEAG